MNSCKVCDKSIAIKRIYCSNSCKFSDKEYLIRKASALKKPISYNFICDLCGWGCNDKENKSGILLTHFVKTHGTIDEFYVKYPHIKKSVRNIVSTKQLSGGIKCEICSKLLQKISNTHLKTHGITSQEYSQKYGTEILSPSLQKHSTKLSLDKQYSLIVSGDRLPPNILPLFSREDYHGVSSRRYQFECQTCGNKFDASLDDGKIPVCRACEPRETFAPNGKAQREVFDYIETLVDGPLIPNDRTLIRPKEVDILCPGNKIAIEYNGLFWHSERYLDKKYHLNKLKMIERTGYQLISIFEDEWINKTNIVKSRLSHVFGKTPIKIYARQTKILEIGALQCNDFLETNHIQGKDSSSVKLGIFFKDELVGVATLAMPRVALGRKNRVGTEVELSRFCYKLFHTIVGGFGKIIRHIIKNYSFDKIVTYADRRYSSIHDNVYQKNDFSFVSETSPGYWYFKPGQIKRYHRFNFTKKKTISLGGDPHKTEWENMVSLGYDRIWDCGHLKYELVVA